MRKPPGVLEETVDGAPPARGKAELHRGRRAWHRYGTGGGTENPGRNTIGRKDLLKATRYITESDHGGLHGVITSSRTAVEDVRHDRLI